MLLTCATIATHKISLIRCTYQMAVELKNKFDDEVNIMVNGQLPMLFTQTLLGYIGKDRKRGN